MKLRPYQEDALNAIVAAVVDGQNRVLIKKPTGTGKTVMFAAIPQYDSFRSWLGMYPENERKMLVLAHREELLEQAAEKFHKLNPHARVSIEQAGRYASPFADVVIASVQSLTGSNGKRLDRLMARHRFRVVIVDEAHHSTATTYRRILARLGFLPMDPNTRDAIDYEDIETMRADLSRFDATANKDQILIGVTATPNRSDSVGLEGVYQTLAYSYELRQAIVDGWLVPIVSWVVETTVSLDDVKLNRGEFNQVDLARAVNQEERNKLAVSAWQKYGEKRPTIAFTVDVAHAHALAAEFQEQGYRAAAVSGETDKDERRDILKRFSRGELDVVANCQVLTEGTDLPITSCILHCKPTRSSTLYEQMTGRGLRLHPGKTDCIVIDLVDVASKHSLMTTAILYGLPVGLQGQGKTLDEMAEVVRRLRDEHPGIDLESFGRISVEALEARARKFDVWQLPALNEHGDGLHLDWIRVEDLVFRLGYPWDNGVETLEVEPDLLGRFQLTVSRSSKEKERSFKGRVMAAGVETANGALRLAEAFVMQHRPRAFTLRNKRASWRVGNTPATAKQLALLRKMKAPIRIGLTKGEASEMLSARLKR